MSGSFYRGTTSEQDGRFANKEKKIIKSQQWPDEFNTRVDIKKVNLKLLRTWIDRKLDEIAGIEDEVVTNFVISELENADEKGPDPKRLQINLEGFLDTRTRPFVTELWEMLIASQNTPEGIADSIVVEQRSEIDQKKIEIEQEVQRIREMMLKIQGKGPTSGTPMPSMPEISGKSAASQSYFKNEAKSRPPEQQRKQSTRHRESSGDVLPDKKKESDKPKQLEHHKKESKRKRSRHRRSGSSNSSSRDARRSRDKKRKEKSKKNREDREAKDKKQERKKKAKLRRRSSSSSSLQSKKESSLSSD